MVFICFEKENAGAIENECLGGGDSVEWYCVLQCTPHTEGSRNGASSWRLQQLHQLERYSSYGDEPERAARLAVTPHATTSAQRRLKEKLRNRHTSSSGSVDEAKTSPLLSGNSPGWIYVAHNKLL